MQWDLIQMHYCSHNIKYFLLFSLSLEIERQTGLPGNDATAHLKEMLHELKEQEERNEEALCRLSTQISGLQG